MASPSPLFVSFLNLEVIMLDWDYEYEYHETVSDSEEFSYDDDSWEYDDEEREEVAILEEEYSNWYEEVAQRIM